MSKWEIVGNFLKELPELSRQFVKSFEKAVAERSGPAGGAKEPARLSRPTPFGLAYVGLVVASLASFILTLAAVGLLFRLLAQRKEEVRKSEDRDPQ